MPTDQMNAVIMDQDKSLHWQQTEVPAMKDDELLINISATAINRADLVQRQGFYAPPPGASTIMGLECAGIVSAVGKKVTKFKEGDSVCALLAGGGYAETVNVHEGSVLPVPAGLSMTEAACLPEVFATAWLNLFMEAGLRPGEKVILHAGASGVGTAAIQLCKSFSSPCFVTAGSDEKIAECIKLGAAAGSNRHSGSFLEQAKEFAGENGVDVILDPVGGGYLPDNIDLLAVNGRLVLIGLMGGAQAEINLGLMLMKRLRVIGSTLRARPVQEKAVIMNQLLEQVWPKIEAGEIKPILHKAMPIEQIEAAHELVASDVTIGKVVLLVNG